MDGLTIGWEYLTGYCVATDPGNRQRAEWPPHPARVFMALAAAWFETGEDCDEGLALRWMEKLGDPDLILPPSKDVFPRQVVEVFVPVNDRADPFDWPDKKKKATIYPRLGSVEVGRSRQARTFPSIWIGELPCFLHWPEAKAVDLDLHRSALEQLCRKVTRIGHSSSLVRMWLAEEYPLPEQLEVWKTDHELAEFHVRRVSDGTLELLDRQFNRKGRTENDQLSREIEKLEVVKKAVKGKAGKERKAEVEVKIGQLKDHLKSIDNSEPVRPKLGLWSGYRRREKEPPSAKPHSAFDSDLLILTQFDSPRLPSVSTLAVTQALRGAVMKQSGIQPPPSWVSGHLEAGQPLRDGKQHLAFVPLPFVSSEHADGHLLGAALVFPHWVSHQERGRVLGPMLMDLSSGQPKPVELQLGALGLWKLMKRDWSEPRLNLKPETWTAHPQGSVTWASVTPVVLDGFSKEDRLRDRAAWDSEVAGMIARACERVGLPEPEAIDFDNTSWHCGSPRASQKRRPLSGHSDIAEASAGLGDGFSPYPAKATTGIRPQYHVWLRFPEPVVGPILLGAGRFLGYGLCKPLRGGPSQ